MKKKTNAKIYTIEISKGNEVIKFAKKLDPNQNLCEIRNKLGDKISFKIIFTLPDGTDIIKDDEKDYTLEEIIDGKIIHLKNIEETLKSDIDIYVNGNFKLKARLMKSEKLDIIRNSISHIITNNGCFLSKEKAEIIKDDESDYILEEILDGNILYIKISNNNIKENQNIPQAPEANVNNSINITPSSSNSSTISNNSSAPIVFSSLIEKKENLEIYKYPIIEFTKEEQNKAIKIMVIGPTGSGKTTLLNEYKLFNGY